MMEYGNHPSPRAVVPFVSVDYDDFKPETYRGFILSMDGETRRFFTGDPAVDLLAMMEWMRDEGHKSFQNSSSFDDFVADSLRREKAH